MKTYRIWLLMLVCVPLLWSCTKDETSMPSVRKERKLLLKGNEVFAEGKFQDAANLYREALKENPGSPEALYNNAVATMALAEQQIARQGSSPDSAALKLEDEAVQLYMQATMLRDRATMIAAFAAYNLGNHYFRTDKLDEAEVYYRQSLRLFPDFDEARRNLRITQLKREQNKDQNNQNQNQQNQDQQDKDKQQDKDQQQNQDQNKDQQDNQNQPQQQPQPQSNMTQQAAQQILNANENKEQNTRARIERQKQQRREQGGSRGKRW